MAGVPTTSNAGLPVQGSGVPVRTALVIEPRDGKLCVFMPLCLLRYACYRILGGGAGAGLPNLAASMGTFDCITVN